MTTPLPPQDPHSPDGMLPGEAELATLYRQLPRSEPGPTLDATVLRAAAQALETDRAQAGVPVERRKSPRERGDWVHPKPLTASPAEPARKSRSRWLVGLGSAAALMLAAGLGWHLHGLPPTGSAPVTSGSAAPVQAEATTAASNAPTSPAPKQPPPRMVDATPPAITTNATALRPTSTAPALVAAAADAGTATNPSDTPAQELDKIRQLFAQGHDDQAQQRLTAFRHAHPQWELPPELQAKLRQP